MNTNDSKTVSFEDEMNASKLCKSLLDETLREGAQKLLKAAIENEVEQYIQLHRNAVDGQGKSLVVRNGHHRKRDIQTGVGTIEVKQPRIRDKQYVYVWVDGVYFNVRLSDDRPCVLVLMGALEDGTKELIAICDGERESKLSWKSLLLDVKDRGLPVASEVNSFWSVPSTLQAVLANRIFPNYARETRSLQSSQRYSTILEFFSRNCILGSSFLDCSPSRLSNLLAQLSMPSLPSLRTSSISMASTSSAERIVPSLSGSSANERIDKTEFTPKNRQFCVP